MRTTGYITALLMAFFLLSECLSMDNNEKKDDRHLLGERLLNSLKDDNIIAYAQCWINRPMANRMAILAKAPEGMLKKQNDIMLDRDRTLAKYFKSMRKILLDLTEDVSKLEIDNISGPIIEDESTHVPLSKPLIVRIRVNASTFVEWKLLGAKINDDWTFASAPDDEVTVIKNGKSTKTEL